MEWIKSSFSNGNGGNNCVEVIMTTEHVHVRDSKDFARGAVLTFTSAEWMAFVHGVRNREFDVQD